MFGFDKKQKFTGKLPVRLTFGIGNQMIIGFCILCEKEDGSAKYIPIWCQEDISLVHFHNGESYVEWENGKVINIMLSRQPR